MTTLSDQELGWRQRKFEQIVAAHDLDAKRLEEWSDVKARRSKAEPTVLAILDRLIKDRDAETFRSDLQGWAKEPGTGFSAFNGVNGMMFVHQLVMNAPDASELGSLLADVLDVPSDDDDADRKLRALIGWVEAVKKGAHPAPRRVPYLCSFFWSLRDHDRWPCIWTSAERMLADLGWLAATDDLADRYLDFRRQVLALEHPPLEVEGILFWFDTHRFVGLDPTLLERCQRIADLNASRREGAYASHADEEDAVTLARCMVSELALLGAALADGVATAVGRSVKVDAQRVTTSRQEGVRSDAWVEWTLADARTAGIGLRVWVNVGGVAVALDPGWVRDGGYEEAAEALLGLIPSDMQLFRRRPGQIERLEEVSPDQLSGNFAIGHRHPGTEMIDNPSLAHEVVRVGAKLQPLFDKLVEIAGGPLRPDQRPPDDPLKSLIEAFIADRGYPTEKDTGHRAEREVMAAMLAADELPVLDVTGLRAITNGGRYGRPGPQSRLNVTLRDASGAEWEAITGKLHDLLWGEGSDESRIDRLLEPPTAIPGLGESVIMKLLAICHPERYVPVFPYTGDMGKVKLMRLIELEPSTAGLSRGARQVVANDTIRHRLDPFFPNDPWGQAQFLYWLNQRPPSGVEPATDLIGALAEELLVDRSFLDDIVGLLRDKGQVVFYGPPGTGKTYIARKLAEVLAPNPNHRMVVQFHPSTTYEDFFEGYRPEGIDGQLSYRLTPGPLAILAERSENAPGTEHVMVIDEINRANLPKVLGELLFLLEYREERVRTVYRPDDAFELPANLLFIGTMNTADRSIALVDAALRRRFHFVPFFPNEGPIAGLLTRWLEANDQSTDVADLVAMVNDELREELGGPDLQIGPSYFMRVGLDEAAVRRIWTYNVFPLIEDTLFGNRERIEQFRFDEVMARYRKQVAPVPATTDEGELSDQ